MPTTSARTAAGSARVGSRRAGGVLAAAALTTLVLSVSACGSNNPAVVLGDTSPAPSAQPSPVAAIDPLTGVSTTVVLDPAFLQGLTTLTLTPAATGKATLVGDRVTFPITGGDLTYFDPSSLVRPFVQGAVDHEGSGLQLTGPNGKVVRLTDFVVDPGTSTLTGSVEVDGTVAAPSAPLFFLDGRTLRPLANGAMPGTAVLAGTTVSLTKAAADLLNTTFGTTALTQFFPVGVAEITVSTGP